MAISIVSDRGRNVVFGATWVPLVGDRTEKVEIGAIAKKYSASRGVRVANEYSTLYGILPREEIGTEEAAQLKRGKAYSAAALLSTTPHVAQDAIWIEHVGEEVHMAALVDSLPVVGSEFVGPVTTALDLIDQIKADHPQRVFTIYGNFRDAFTSSIHLALSDLTDGQEDAGAAFDSLKQSNTVQLLILLAIVLGVAGYVFGPQYFHKPAPVQPAKAPEDPNAAYWRAIPRKLHDEALPVSAVRDVVVGNWGDDVLQGGWLEQSITCSVTSCSYEWMIAGGDNASFVAAMGKRAYVYSSDGQTITYPIANGPVGSARIDARRLPTYQEFAQSVGSLLQKLALLQVKSTLSTPTLFGAELLPGVDTSAIREAVRVGQITINGRAAVLKPLLAELPDSLSIDSVKILVGAQKSMSATPDPTFTLIAKYYVKN